MSVSWEGAGSARLKDGPNRSGIFRMVYTGSPSNRDTGSVPRHRPAVVALRHFFQPQVIKWLPFYRADCLSGMASYHSGVLNWGHVKDQHRRENGCFLMADNLTADRYFARVIQAWAMRAAYSTDKDLKGLFWVNTRGNCGESVWVVQIKKPRATKCLREQSFFLSFSSFSFLLWRHELYHNFAKRRRVES